jgi:thiamine-phosphate pyrophosphorylase
MDKEKKMRIFRSAGIYPVLTPEFTNGRDLVFVLEELAAGGAELVQLRMKNASPPEILKTAEKFKNICDRTGILLIINDRVDIALACGADGVHLGQDDFPANTAVAKFAKDLIIGVSTHSLEEALKAQKDGADYINIGPLFKTETKENLVAPLGIEIITTIREKIKIPFTVMGGIKSGHIPALLAAGAKRIAMVTEITMAENIRANFMALKELY